MKKVFILCPLLLVLMTHLCKADPKTDYDEAYDNWKCSAELAQTLISDISYDTIFLENGLKIQMLRIKQNKESFTLGQFIISVGLYNDLAKSISLIKDNKALYLRNTYVRSIILGLEGATNGKARNWEAGALKLNEASAGLDSEGTPPGYIWGGGGVYYHIGQGQTQLSNLTSYIDNILNP